MNPITALNRLPALKRRLVKSMILGVTTLAVCFPRIGLLARHVERWTNPNALIEPNAPELAPLVRQLDARLAKDAPAAVALSTVQQLVYEALPYEWDWVNWGNADYIPTVSEALRAGAEDCDGRAVVAASLLRRLGYQSTLVTDFVHVWVHTEAGDTMSPGDRTAIVARDGGIEVASDALTRLPRALGFGLSVFYVHRELIVLAVLWLMLIHPGLSRWRGASSLVLLVSGLFLLRFAGADWRAGHAVLGWAGLTAFGLAGLAAWSRRRPDRATPVTCDAASGAAPTRADPFDTSAPGDSAPQRPCQ